MDEGQAPGPSPRTRSAAQDDWSQMASGLHGFFSALIASGFAEHQALHLSAYLNSRLAVMLTNAAAQQPEA